MKPADQIALHIAFLFRPSEIVGMRGLGDNGRVLEAWHSAGDVEAIVRTANAWRAMRFNVYIGFNPRPRNGAKGDKCIQVARCHFADFDDLKSTAVVDRLAETKERIRAKGIPDPALVTHTGRGCHAFWPLAQDQTNLSEWSDHQHDLAMSLGSDESICNPERIHRLAGTTNFKKAPVPCEIMEYAPENVYEWCDLDEPIAIHLPEPVPETDDAGELIEDHIQTNRQDRTDASVIDAFNDAADLRQILRSKGYFVTGSKVRRAGKDKGAFSGSLMECRDGRLRSFHFSKEDKLYSTKFRSKNKGYVGIADAFDAFTVLVHGGDVRRAVRDAARILNVPLPKQKCDEQVIKDVLASEHAESFAKAFCEYKDAENKTPLRLALAGILKRFTTNPVQIDRFIMRAAKGAM